jgi:hypothetical protein
MRIAPVADVKARFSQYLQQSEKGPVIVTKNGDPSLFLSRSQTKPSWSAWCWRTRPGSDACLTQPSGA